MLSNELAARLCELSRDIGRQIGLIIEREGIIAHIIVGDGQGILIPSLGRYSLGRGKLRGVRCVHTHLRGAPITEDDLADLTLLRLDALAVLETDAEGKPGALAVAHLLPPNPEGETYRLLPVADFYGYTQNFGKFVESLGDEIAAKQERTVAVKEGEDRAILVHVSKLGRAEIADRMSELRELCRTAGAAVVEEVVQRPRPGRARYLVGEGKMRDLAASALQKGAELIVFDQELTPAQVRAIAELVEVRVIDRTQLILDVFARRAHTPDGKVQVELAQLKYILPRLAGKGTAMSRLMGGVGGRGPGESKLEMDRRRVRTRISKLEKRLKALARGRVQRRKKRGRASLPIVSIVGYTNAGKSTLLNALTASEVFTEDLLFATLDTATRRMRFPREREIIITDTVGFLRDLPKGLLGAFQATLEELEDATLLMHVVDISNPAHEKQMAAVDKLLLDLELGDKPILIVFNKADLVDPKEAEQIAARHSAVLVSAKKRASFTQLISRLEERFWKEEPKTH